jgi:hypothetical protein
MTNEQILQLATQGGIGVVALVIIGKIGLRVAERIIDALGALAKEARDTGKATVDALSSLTERLSRLEGKVEVLGAASGVDVWPESETSEVRRTRREHERARSSPQIESEGGYGPTKPRR